MYDKRNDFDFDIVNFLFLDGDLPRRASYGVYILQLIRLSCYRLQHSKLMFNGQTSPTGLSVS